MLIVFLFNLPVFGQNREYLIYKSDTLSLIITEQDDSTYDYGHQSPIDEDGYEYESNQINYWEIINDSLFEVRLFNTKMSFRIFQYNMNRILYCPDGELLKDFGLTQIYRKEKGLKIKNGILTEIKKYDNSLSVISLYSNMDSIFYNYLSANIDYSKLDTENCTRVYLQIKNKNRVGEIQGIDIIHGCNEKINKELIHVIEKIPQWNTIYLHGIATDYCNIIVIDLDSIKYTAP